MTNEAPTPAASIEAPPPREGDGHPGLRWIGDGALRSQRLALEGGVDATARGRGWPQQQTTVLDGLVLASFVRRAFAWVIDRAIKVLLFALILTLAQVEVTAPAEGELPARSLLAAWYLISIGFDWIFFTPGWTPGSRLLGMRTVRAEDGREPGPWRALIRVAGSLFSDAALGLGFAWAAWHPRRQTWHDMLARTYVVMAPKRTPDEKR